MTPEQLKASALLQSSITTHCCHCVDSPNYNQLANEQIKRVSNSDSVPVHKSRCDSVAFVSAEATDDNETMALAIMPL